MAPVAAVRELERALRATGVPVTALYLPHTDHMFDMVGWSWSPAARAATSVLERFLAGLAEGADHVDRRTPSGVGTTHHP